MIRRRTVHWPRQDFPLAPMIDVVFLLLIYFMATSSLHRAEANLGVSLPGTVTPETPLSAPAEALVELDAAGRPALNGTTLDAATAPEYSELSRHLARLAASASTTGSNAQVLLRPAGATPHHAVIKALDAAEAAGIESVRFVSD